MKKLLIILPLIFLAGCEYRYRYECQDPANWGKESCNNDVCKADGECTSDVLGFNPSTMTNNTQDFAGRNDQSISNTDCKPPVAANTLKPKNTFKPNRSDDSFKKMNLEESEEMIEEDFVRTPLTMETEAPLTMNTVVETMSHNKAAKINNW
jgi:hypothetical protein